MFWTYLEHNIMALLQRNGIIHIIFNTLPSFLKNGYGNSLKPKDTKGNVKSAAGYGTIISTEKT